MRRGGGGNISEEEKMVEQEEEEVMSPARSTLLLLFMLPGVLLVSFVRSPSSLSLSARPIRVSRGGRDLRPPGVVD